MGWRENGAVYLRGNSPASWSAGGNRFSALLINLAVKGLNETTERPQRDHRETTERPQIGWCCMVAVDRLITSPVLIGRVREVELLSTALRTLRQGTGQVVLLAGEAGVGKSRLVTECRQRAASDGFTILQGHCFERDLLFPYAPIIDALRSFLAPQPAATIADLLGVLATELVKLLPELALAIPHVQPTPALHPEAEKRRLFETLVHLLIRFTQGSSPAPLLLILEDLHWGDETSLDLLHLLARRVTAYPIFVLATYRLEEVSPHLQQLLGQLGRGRLAQEVALARLTQDEVHALLQAIFAQRRPIRAEFLETIYGLTEGNPFFIEEVIKVLVAAGDVFYADDGWTRKPMQELHIPPSVQEAVQRRTALVSAAARQLLTLAAVVGRRFDFALLQQVAGRNEHELLSLIKELIAAQLVVEETSEQFVFRHALIQQAVYASLLGRERRMLHQLIGEASEHVYAEALDAQAGDLAYHFYEAGEWAQALAYAQRAGEQARALYAPRAAVQQFTRALVAARHLPAAPPVAYLYRARGLAYDTLGDFEQARADLETALALAHAGDKRSGEWQALLDLGQLWASRNYAQTGDYFRRALALARTLDDPAPLARTLNRVGNWHLNMERAPDALRCHREALAIFQTLDDRRGVAQTFDFLGMASLLGGDPVYGAAYLQQAIALYQALDDRQGLAASLTTLSICGVSYTTEVVVPASVSAVECSHHSERAQGITREIGWRAGEAAALVFPGFRLGAQGQYGQALDCTQRGLVIAEEIEHRQWMCLAHRVLGLLYLDLLALPAARQHLEQALALAKEIGSLYHTRMMTGNLISLCLEEQAFAQAESLLKEALTPELPMQTLAQRGIWRGRAELALAQKAPDLASQIVDRLLASAANMESREVGVIPSLAKLQGKTLAALQRWSEAEAMLQSAQAAAQGQNTPRLIWRIDVALGELYQAQRRRAQAAQAFAAAHSVVEAIAATVPDPQLRAHFLRQATALIPQPPPASPLQVTKQTFGGLTRRERDVAVQIAQGQSNRAIAETLFLSERTVETYVSNILAKLSFTARTQIAAWAVEVGLAKREA
jgi:DNA-binding NarL/FixJ family response regulator